MAADYRRTLSSVQSARDLRAEILALATKLEGNSGEAQLVIEEPSLSPATVQKEWDAAVQVFKPSIRDRVHLVMDPPTKAARLLSTSRDQGIIPLERPNYRYEVLRQLVGASLEGRMPHTTRTLAESIGASLPTVRAASAAFQQAGLCRRWGAHHVLDAKNLSAEYIAQLQALPQMLRFRFAQGTYPRPPAELVSRAMLLMGAKRPPEWTPFALSGTPVALASVPKVDLLGTPRLDLAAYVPREASSIDVREALRKLDSGLELEPNPLAAAPVVVTLIRAKSRGDQLMGDPVRWAAPADVFLSLLDLGLAEQAHQYADELQSHGSRL